MGFLISKSNLKTGMLRLFLRREIVNSTNTHMINERDAGVVSMTDKG